MIKESDKELLSIPETLPLLPVKDIVVFPYMVLPLFVSREKSIKSLEEALSKDRLIFLVAQKKLSEEDFPNLPSYEEKTTDISDIRGDMEVNVIARIIRIPSVALTAIVGNVSSENGLTKNALTTMEIIKIMRTTHRSID